MRHLPALTAPLLTAALVLAAAASPALADGLIVVPPTVPDQPHVRNVPLWVRSHRVEVTVENRVALTEIDQVFVNPNPRRLEGTYLFPLPRGAAIDRFSMWVDGQELSAELLDASRARGIYEDIVRRQLDPALLEYAEQGLFRARIFPIEPNSEKRVRIRYAELLPADNGTVAYRYPLNTEKFSSRPLDDVSVRVTIRSDDPVASVWSPSHRVDVPRDLGTEVRVGWEERGVKPDRDFLLYFRPTRKAVGLSVVAHRDPGADPEGTFLVLAAPRTALDAPAQPKDVVFVMDTSGSMLGAHMEQARSALRFCLRSLGPDDRFGIVPFATEPRAFRPALAAPDADTVAAAERFVDGLEARGGTAIDDALRTGLEMLSSGRSAERPAFLLFLTDGLPTIGQTDPDAILRRAKERLGDARLFVFGVGPDVNTRLLDRLAEEGRGARDYVALTESIEEKVSSLYSKIARPAMTDVSLAIEGVAVSAVHPRELGDLFHGSELIVAGRYAEGGPAVLRLTGRIGGRPVTIVEELRLPEKEVRHEFLPRLWAVRRVGFLMDQMRLHGETAEVRDEVVSLAKRFGIVTPWTSYLILEDDARPGRPAAGGPLLGGPGAGAGRGRSSLPPTAEEAAAAERLRDEARKARQAAEAESGDGAVGLSRDALGLRGYQGERDSREDASGGLVRHVEGRTFVSRGGVWWQLDVDAEERVRVESFSADYFDLVRRHPEIGPWLALGKVVLEVGGRVYEIG